MIVIITEMNNIQIDQHFLITIKLAFCLMSTMNSLIKFRHNSTAHKNQQKRTSEDTHNSLSEKQSFSSSNGQNCRGGRSRMQIKESKNHREEEGPSRGRKTVLLVFYRYMCVCDSSHFKLQSIFAFLIDILPVLDETKHACVKIKNNNY